MAPSQSVFQILCDFLLISGLFSYQVLQGWKVTCFKIYIGFTMSILLYGIAIIINGALAFGKVPYFLILGGLVVWVIFDTAYFYVKEEKVRQLLKMIENLKDTFENNSLITGGFGECNKKFTVKIQRFMMCYILVQSTLPVINGTAKLVRFLGLFGMDGQIAFIIPSTYDVDYSQHPYFYSLDLYSHVFLFTFVCLKQATSECFFTCLFLHMTSYFDHLHTSVTNIYCSTSNVNTRSTLRFLRLRDNVDEILAIDSRLLQQGVGSLEPPNNILELERAMHSEDEKNLNAWAKMHQEVLNVSRELIVLYHPVLLVQFAMMFFLFVVLAFTLSMETHKRTLDDVEISIIGSYWIMIMTVFFIMCLTGNELNRFIMKSVLTVLVALMQMQRRQHGTSNTDLK